MTIEKEEKKVEEDVFNRTRRKVGWGGWMDNISKEVPEDISSLEEAFEATYPELKSKVEAQPVLTLNDVEETLDALNAEAASEYSEKLDEVLDAFEEKDLEEVRRSVQKLDDWLKNQNGDLSLFDDVKEGLKEQTATGYQANVRQEDGTVHAVTKDTYSILQHLDSAKWLDELVAQEEGAEFSRVAKINNTRTGVEIGAWPAIVQLEPRTLQGESYIPLIMVRNTFDGTSSARAYIVPVREEDGAVVTFEPQLPDRDEKLGIVATHLERKHGIDPSNIIPDTDDKRFDFHHATRNYAGIELQNAVDNVVQKAKKAANSTGGGIDIDLGEVIEWENIIKEVEGMDVEREARQNMERDWGVSHSGDVESKVQQHVESALTNYQRYLEHLDGLSDELTNVPIREKDWDDLFEVLEFDDPDEYETEEAAKRAQERREAFKDKVEGNTAWDVVSAVAEHVTSRPEDDRLAPRATEQTHFSNLVKKGNKKIEAAIEHFRGGLAAAAI